MEIDGEISEIGMIQKIKLQGFLKFRNEKIIEFAEGINVLKGTPESGKLDIIEAIYFILSKKYEDQRKAVLLRNEFRNVEDCFVCIYFLLDEEVEFNFEKYQQFSVTRHLSPEKCDFVEIRSRGIKKLELHITDFYTDLIESKLLVLPEPNFKQQWDISNADLKALWFDGTHIERTKEIYDDFNADHRKARPLEIENYVELMQQERQTIVDIKERLFERFNMEQALYEKRSQDLEEKYANQPNAFDIDAMNTTNKLIEHNKMVARMNEFLMRNKSLMDHFHEKRMKCFEDCCTADGTTRNQPLWQPIIDDTNRFMEEIQVFENRLNEIRQVLNLKKSEEIDLKIYHESNVLKSFGAEEVAGSSALAMFSKHLGRYRGHLVENEMVLSELNDKAMQFEQNIRKALNEVRKDCENWNNRIGQYQNEEGKKLVEIRALESRLFDSMNRVDQRRKDLMLFLNVEQTVFKPVLSNGIQLVYNLLSKSDPKYMNELIGQVIDFIDPGKCEQYQNIFDAILNGISVELSTFIFNTQATAEEFAILLRTEMNDMKKTAREMNEKRFGPDTVGADGGRGAYVWDDIVVKSPKFICKINSYERIRQQRHSNKTGWPDLIHPDVLQQYPHMEKIFDKYLIVDRVPTPLNPKKIYICTADGNVYKGNGVQMQAIVENRYGEFIDYLNSNHVELREQYFECSGELKQVLTEYRELKLQLGRIETQQKIAKKCLIGVLTSKVHSLNNNMHLLNEVKLGLHDTNVKNFNICEQIRYNEVFIGIVKDRAFEIQFKNDIQTLKKNGLQVPDLQFPQAPETTLPMLCKNNDVLKTILNQAGITKNAATTNYKGTAAKVNFTDGPIDEQDQNELNLQHCRDLEEKIMLNFQNSFFEANPENPYRNQSTEELQRLLDDHDQSDYILPQWDYEQASLLFKKDLRLPEGLSKRVKNKIYDDLSFNPETMNGEETVDELIGKLNKQKVQRTVGDGFCETFKQVFCGAAYENLVDSVQYLDRALHDCGRLKILYKERVHRGHNELKLTSQTVVDRLPMNFECFLNPESELEICFQDQMDEKNLSPPTALLNARDPLAKLHFYLHTLYRTNPRLIILDKALRDQQPDTADKILGIYQGIVNSNRLQNQWLIVHEDFPGPHQAIVCKYKRNRNDVSVKIEEIIP